MMKHINKIEEKKVAVRLRAKREKTDSREEIIFIATVELVEATYTHALTPPNAFSSAAGEWQKIKKYCFVRCQSISTQYLASPAYHMCRGCACAPLSDSNTARVCARRKLAKHQTHHHQQSPHIVVHAMRSCRSYILLNFKCAPLFC